MKLLNMTVDDTPSTSPYNLKAIPAELHDTAGEIYGDILYSLYTVTNSVIDNNIRTAIVTKNLVQHTYKNGEKGYWVGVGLDSELVDGAMIYKTWGNLDTDVELETLKPEDCVRYFEMGDGTQTTDGRRYVTYYFNAALASDHENVATIIVNKDGIHYHYLIDFSGVDIVAQAPQLELVAWNAVSVKAIKNNYLFGINLADSNGNPLPEELFIHYLNAAVDYVQNLLDIIICDTDFTERHDYIRNDYRNWGFIQLAHNPVKEVKRVTLMYGQQRAVEIPLDWVQLNKLTGQITLFPSAGSANSLIIGQTGLLFGFQSQWDWAPMLWEVEYTAGIDENDPAIPFALLKETIFKRASMGILNVWGDLIIGAGIASQSVSIDGISQSIGTTQSAMFGGASARIEAYAKDIDERLLPVLRQKFGGIRMIVV